MKAYIAGENTEESIQFAQEKGCSVMEPVSTIAEFESLCKHEKFVLILPSEYYKQIDCMIQRMMAIKTEKKVMMVRNEDTADIIIRVVCAAFGTYEEEMLYSMNKQNISDAKSVAAELLKEYTALTYAQISKRLSGKQKYNHSTSISRRKKFGILYGSDKKYTEKANIAKQKLKNMGVI